jgi:hypothetical protein
MKQFPVVAADARTIHKLQGRTLDCCRCKLVLYRKLDICHSFSYKALEWTVSANAFGTPQMQRYAACSSNIFGKTEKKCQHDYIFFPTNCKTQILNTPGEYCLS